MSGSNVLVFGATGPLGICLLRELLHRQHLHVIVYARNPAKIPDEIVSDTTNARLEVIKGELDDGEAISTAVSKANVVVSLLGPKNLTSSNPAIFADFYALLFEQMRRHGVKRIFATATGSISAADDNAAVMRFVLVSLVRLFSNQAYHSILAIGKVFEEHAAGLDWTIYRIMMIPGGDDEVSWKKDREDGKTFEGWIGHPGWTFSQKRGALARSLVDAVEDGKTMWIGKMPAISRLAGS